MKPEKSPDQIILEILPSETDRKALANLLIGYYKVNDAQWDDYRKKIAPPLLLALKEIIAEMRRNGFVGLGAELTLSGKMRFRWGQVVDNRVKEPIIPGELCDGCGRSCHRKDFNGVFRPNTVKCWQR